MFCCSALDKPRDVPHNSKILLIITLINDELMRSAGTEDLPDNVIAQRITLVGPVLYRQRGRPAWACNDT